MGKRRAPLDSNQLSLFDAPVVSRGEAALAGLKKQTAAAVSTVLHEEIADRYEIAKRMSFLLDEEVSKLMLDGYSSPAREDHNIPAHRLLALIAVTGRLDVLDGLLRRAGFAALDEKELMLTQLGHLDRQMAEIKAKKREIERLARPSERGT
jgi:hypothetical protein